MQHKIPLDEDDIKARYGRGDSVVTIGEYLGVSYQTVYRRLVAAGVEIRPQARTQPRPLSNARPLTPYTTVKMKIVGVLRDGNRYTAKMLQDRVGPGDIWGVLIQLEKDGLAYRAAVQGDWQTFNGWKLTGCGRIAWFNSDNSNRVTEIVHQSAPDFQATHNIGERLPNSDTAVSGAPQTSLSHRKST